jgi:hypothetical protein
VIELWDAVVRKMCLGQKVRVEYAATEFSKTLGGKVIFEIELLSFK